ncbi:DUF1284 domain-containing protein [Dichotomicrobium thermohalophilum]|uniref:DUF1284 domain-containing protein n=1 Tax=Dichotomicrobium thermohalophilum TaxID=933063 RepID=A0A397PD59_9HYPH|nr:DUF1284 domain-containing protein [Dichotomicrobium thermohalophilum]RIA47436.1 hypothetical protein BXY53_2515 [Dichotomicrobium thermohalophilum]
MTVRLRAHHLLCMLTYAGDGYSRAFTANFDAMVARIAAGEEVLIVAGPDDICAPLLCEAECHCLRDSVRARDELAARDLGRLLGIDLSEEQRLLVGKSELRRMRAAFAGGETREACRGCEWHGLCTRVARRGFRGAKLGRTD